MPEALWLSRDDIISMWIQVILSFPFCKTGLLQRGLQLGTPHLICLKQKQTAVPKTFVFMILTFLLLLSLPAWCFRYIVSLF